MSNNGLVEDKLATLQDAFDEYYERESARIQNENTCLRAFVQGRGLTGKGTKNLDEAVRIFDGSLRQFLRG